MAGNEYTHTHTQFDKRLTISNECSVTVFEFLILSF